MTGRSSNDLTNSYNMRVQESVVKNKFPERDDKVYKIKLN